MHFSKSGCWIAEIGAPSWSNSGEALLLSCRLLTCILTLCSVEQRSKCSVIVIRALISLMQALPIWPHLILITPQRLMSSYHYIRCRDSILVEHIQFITVFKLFTFKVIINMLKLTSVILSVFVCFNFYDDFTKSYYNSIILKNIFIFQIG